MLAGAGSVRVDVQNPQGRSITLYRIEPGQLCIHSLINLISDDVYGYVATAETDGWFCWADKHQFNLWMQQSEAFQHWIFNNIGGRFRQVIDNFAQHSFVPVEKRLAELLIEKLGHEQTIIITQAELASELGTAREIVSRHLSRWQKDGWISTGRGQIDILDFESLLQASE
jgi:CRP/FNR family transcriptional regulator